MRILYIPKSSKPSYPITRIGHTSFWANMSNPASKSISIDADSTFLVVCVRSVTGSLRTGGAPTWNGVEMTEAGSYYGSFRSEIWYLQNPDIGTYSLNVPNSLNTNIYATTSWYKSDGNISLSNTQSYTGSGTLIGGEVSVPPNAELLLIDSIQISQDGLKWNNVSSTDYSLFVGVTGAEWGAASQCKTYKSDSVENYTMTRTITVSKTWSDVIAVFVSS